VHPERVRKKEELRSNMGDASFGKIGEGSFRGPEVYWGEKTRKNHSPSISQKTTESRRIKAREK